MNRTLRSLAARRRARLHALLLILGLGFAAPAAAAGDFEPNTEYALRLGEQIAPSEIYFSKRHVAYVVTSAALERSLLISLPEASVSAIEGAFEGMGGEMPGAGEKLGGFERRLGEIRFQLGGEAAALVPAPPLVGWQTARSLRSEDLVMKTGFARVEKHHGAALEGFVFSSNVEVEVFFGSWDAFSQRVIPKIMQLEQSLEGESVLFHYYGLPRRLADDAQATDRGIHGVPTLIVTANGRELGRLLGRALDQPGESLHRLLEAELSP